jgi:hypothetical protein
MTDDQKTAFGFAGKNITWTETIKLIEAIQQQQWMTAVSRETKGEDRIHACGSVDGINLILSTLVQFRQDARKLNGLTPNEDLA